MKSWKIGAISGLIAGFVAGIVAIFCDLINFKLELPSWVLYGAPPLRTPLICITLVEFIINIIWGTILGIFYVKFYELIPGKRFFKGLIFGTILGIIFTVRNASFMIPYGLIDYTIAWIIYAIHPIAYGIALGILCEFLQSRYHPSLRKLKPQKYDIGRGIQAGAIAGLIGGIVISFAHMRFLDPLAYSKYLTDVGFLTSQLGTHSFMNMMWGTVFGILYAMFFSKIPGKRILKGFIFGMMVFFMTSLRGAIYFLLFGDIASFTGWGNAIFLFSTFGIILGYLYNPRK